MAAKTKSLRPLSFPRASEADRRNLLSSAAQRSLFEIDFGVGAGCGGINRFHDTLNVRTKAGPLLQS